MAEQELPSSTSIAPDGRRSKSISPLEYAPPFKNPSRRYLVFFQKALDGLKTLAWVAPLTILIWIYAEREQSIPVTNVTFPIEVRVSDNNRLVTLKDPADHNVVATLSGPRSAVDRAIHDLQAGGSDRALVQIDVDPRRTRPRGEFNLSSGDVIANNLFFVRQGISVRDVSPTNLRVEIDDYEIQEVPVRPPDNLPTVKDVRFAPGAVKVKAPSSVWRAIEQGNKKPYVIGDLSKLAESAQPGPHTVKFVPVIWPGAREHVTIARPTIEATFEVQRQEKKAQLPSVPVYTKGPPSFDDKYKVELQLPGGAKTLSQVPVVGPPDTIDKLLNGELTATADIQPALTGAPGTTRTAAVKFDLPDGVRFDGDPEKFQVPYTLVERNANP
jgi:hypothetical protein